MDPVTWHALSALVVGDALGQVPLPVQAAVLVLMIGTAAWAATRRRAAALLAFVACALVWARANQGMEGAVLVTVSPEHGLTLADLLPPALTALVLARTAASRRVQESKPRPNRSSVRSHTSRRPSRESARAIERRVSATPIHLAGSGGNGNGRVRTSSSRVRSVSTPASRSSATRAPNRDAPTPSPV